ncbi:molybdate ABC transporter substrate-binding protein [Rouxiella badensis]|uniref:molybdate ABC transporter substrate-binding protein n=1 Tax=Rouxiella badensis TaxID=1646377 RepID=UPI0022AABB83|nr:substrate-binding domain-containing protein [Rouxiella badensis]WAT09221.1 substrate-binding domain-containing protein [Rouxiella badensis]
MTMTQATPVEVICAFVVRSPFDAEILPAWEQQGHAVQVKWDTTSVIMESIRSGFRSDVALVTVSAMDELVAEGIVDADSRVELVESNIGIAVKAGEAHPDISSKAAFIATLLEARSVAYSLGGASGIYFKSLIEKLGIAAEINAKATTLPGGFTAEKLLTGEASLAIQQISELLAVQGIEIVGRLPDAVQKPTSFSAAVFKEAKNPALSREFLKHLQSSSAANAYQAKGLDPLF